MSKFLIGFVLAVSLVGLSACNANVMRGMAKGLSDSHRSPSSRTADRYIYEEPTHCQRIRNHVYCH
jgi:hypothetical protein